MKNIKAIILMLTEHYSMSTQLLKNVKKLALNGGIFKLLENYSARIHLVEKLKKRHKDFWKVTEDSLDKSMIVFKIDRSMKNELLNI